MPKVRCADCSQYVERDEAVRAGVQSFCDDDCRRNKAQSYQAPRKALSGSKIKRKKPSNPMPDGRREEVLEADGNKCRFCGSRGGVFGLHVHHVRYRGQPGGTHERNNLLTLCSECHDVVHSNKKLYQPACLALLAVREATGDKASRVTKYVERKDDTAISE